MQIRLVDENGDMVGIVPRNEGLDMAADAGLDLVEISPNADPPVCKILDFGKYKYEEQKKKNEARKRQKVIEVKEVKFRPSIDDHDSTSKCAACISSSARVTRSRLPCAFAAASWRTRNSEWTC